MSGKEEEPTAPTAATERSALIWEIETFAAIAKKTSPEAIPDANVAGRTRGRARSKNADYPLPFARMFLSFAPAGMGFEYDLLKQAAPEAAGYPVFEMDLAFLESQLRAMEPYACGKFPGIEINYREGVVPTSAPYVRESLDAIMGHGFDGAVLSWNIMEAPKAHIDCLHFE